MKKITTLLAILSLTACYSANEQDITANKTAETQKDEQKTQLTKQHWQPLHSDLWQSNTGEIGFQVAIFDPETDDFSEGFLTHFCDNEGLPFSQVIDVDSFHTLNDSNYYKDKKHLYVFHPMAGGGTFAVFDEQADYDSFKVLNSCFAKDNQQIFNWQGGTEDNYDYESFQTCADCGCVGKDKNAYHVVGQELTQVEVDEMIANPETDKHTKKALKVLQNK